MKLREDRQRDEFDALDTLASFSIRAKRPRFSLPHAYLTEFEVDRNRILNCSHFRLLQHKTQLFPPLNPYAVRTRLTHSIEVALIGRTIAGAVGLNESLVEAIALGHDIGHPPFGHTFEQFLRDKLKTSGSLPGFEHNEQGLHVIDKLATLSGNQPLNLTNDTRAGILLHCRPRIKRYEQQGIARKYDEILKTFPADFFISYPSDEIPPSFEAQVVAIADEVAWLTHDIEDAIQLGVLSENSLPVKWRKLTDGYAVRSELVDNIIEHFVDERAKLATTVERAGGFAVTYFDELKSEIDELKDKVFREELWKPGGPVIRLQEDAKKAFALFEHLEKNPPADAITLADKHWDGNVLRGLSDYFCGMTELEVIEQHDKVL